MSLGLGRGLLCLALGAGLLLLPGPVAAQAAPLPTTVNECWSDDNGLPVIDDVAISPDPVDVTTGPATVSIAVQAHDTGGPGDPTGVAEVETVGHGGVDVSTALVRSEDGTWRTQLVIPEGAPADIPVDIVATDRAGRMSAATVAHLSVLSEPDTTKPRLTDLQLSAAAVDTRQRPATVVVTATVADDGSGPGTGVLTLHHSGVAERLRMQPVGDTGRFRAAVPVPRWVGDGRWRISLELWDRVGNRLVLQRDDLATWGAGFAVRSGPLDTTAPRLVEVRHWARAVDVRTSGRSLMVAVVVADNHAVDGVRLRDRVLGLDVALHRVSGTARRGVWQARVPISTCVPGPLTLRATLLRTDRLGNDATSALPTVRVRSQDRLAPHVVRRTLDGSAFTVTFNEPVHGISGDNVDVFDTTPTDDGSVFGPPLAGTWTCHDGTATQTSCLSGSVRTATFAPTDDTARPDVLDLQPEHHLDVLDRHGNPAERMFYLRGF